MDTPDEKDIAFDWQDSVEEMLPTDPPVREGMGDDAAIEAAAHIEPIELPGPVPSTEYSPETDTDATEREKQKYGLDDGEPPYPPVGPVPIESAMDTDSDEEDFSIEDRFEGEISREDAEYDFSLIRETPEDQP